MIDKDGIERPDTSDQHMRKIGNGKRKVKFDDTYPFYPRNIFFRIWAAIFRAAAICVFNPYMYFKRGLHRYGYNKIKKLDRQGFVMTCNHVHVLDDLSVGTNLFAWRKIYFTTLEENIRMKTIGFFLRSLGGMPIPKSSLSGMKKFNEDVSLILSKKKPVLFNPEASMWPFYREIRPFKRGAFQAAARNDVPLLPIVALFKRRKKKNGKFKYNIYFAICDIMHPDNSIADERERSEKLKDDAYAICKQVADGWYAIQDCGFDDEVGLPKLKASDLVFKDNKWALKEKAKKRLAKRSK